MAYYTSSDEEEEEEEHDLGWPSLASHINECREFHVDRVADAESETVECATYDATMISGLADLQRKGVLCDVELVSSVDGTRVCAHRAVLVVHSTFFSRLFTGGNGMIEERSGEVRVEVRGCVLAALVGFCYTGRLGVGEDTAIDLLHAADWMGMHALASLVAGWLLRSVHAGNVLHVWLAAARTRHPHLVARCATCAYIAATSGLSAPLSALRCQLEECSLDHLKEMLAAAADRAPSVSLRSKTTQLARLWIAVDEERQRHGAELGVTVDEAVSECDVAAMTERLNNCPTVAEMTHICQTAVRLLTEEDARCGAMDWGEDRTRPVIKAMQQERLPYAFIVIIRLQATGVTAAAVRALAKMVEMGNGNLAEELCTYDGGWYVPHLAELIGSPLRDLSLAALELVHSMVAAEHVIWNSRCQRLFECDYPWCGALLEVLETTSDEDEERLTAITRIMRYLCPGGKAGLITEDVKRRLAGLLSHRSAAVRSHSFRGLASIAYGDRHEDSGVLRPLVAGAVRLLAEERDESVLLAVCQSLHKIVSDRFRFSFHGQTPVPGKREYLEAFYESEVFVGVGRVLEKVLTGTTDQPSQTAKDIVAACCALLESLCPRGSDEFLPILSRILAQIQHTLFLSVVRVLGQGWSLGGRDAARDGSYWAGRALAAVLRCDERGSFARLLLSQQPLDALVRCLIYARDALARRCPDYAKCAHETMLGDACALLACLHDCDAVCVAERLRGVWPLIRQIAYDPTLDNTHHHLHRILRFVDGE